METIQKKKAFEKLDKKFGSNASDAIVHVIDLVSMEILKKIDQRFDKQDEKMQREIANLHKDLPKEIANLNKFRFTSILSIFGISVTLLAALYGIYQFLQIAF